MSVNGKKNVDPEELKEYSLVREECNQTDKSPAKKSWKRKILRLTALFFAGIVVLLLMIFIFRDFLIEQNVRHIGSLIVGTKVEMDSFKSTLGGTIELKGLKIANPAGYKKPYAFEVDSVFIKLDNKTLTSQEPVIEAFKVNGIRIDLESKGFRQSNLSDIQANLTRFAGSGKKEEKKDEKVAEKGNKVSPLIKDIALTSIVLSISDPSLNTTLSVPLVPLHLANVGGKNSQFEDSVLMIFNALMVSVNQVAGTVSGGLVVIGNAGKTVGTGLQKGASAVGEAGKSVVSGFQSVGEGVTDFFKKK